MKSATSFFRLLAALSALAATHWAGSPRAQAAPLVIQTTRGAMPAGETGLMLPHEHIFTDLRGPTTPGYAQADPADVSRVMKPLLDAASTQGVSVLVECSSIGVGRNVPILARLGNETALRIVVPTGVYGRGAYAPAEYEAMSETQLRDWMVREITVGIDATGVRAGFIKLACDATALTAAQQRFLRAAARASLQTGAAIAIHTPTGARAVEQADILEAQGAALDRFIWVHAQSEPDLNVHKQLAARGVYVEYDSIGSGSPTDQQYIQKINDMAAAGYGNRILLSHDAGWYQPGSANGGTQRGYTYLIETFLPALRAGGASDTLVTSLTVHNPRRAFALPAPPARAKPLWRSYTWARRGEAPSGKREESLRHAN
jgi:phosphotriesterase-related protein